jgi:hypothetical protein
MSLHRVRSRGSLSDPSQRRPRPWLRPLPRALAAARCGCTPPSTCSRHPPCSLTVLRGCRCWVAGRRRRRRGERCVCVCVGGGGVDPARRMYARRRSRVLYRESTRDSSTCSGGGGGCKAREHTRARLADTTIYRAQAFAGLTGNHWLCACWLRSSAGPVREDEWSACARAMGHSHVRASGGRGYRELLIARGRRPRGQA